MTTGLISTVQGYSIKDGPGIRSTVFCVGCNLRCKWCSNPELMLPGKKTMRFAVGGKERTQEVGVEITPEALAAKLVRDRIFYEETGGGVTFSGGEAALQADFVAQTARLLADKGILSALDTAGDVPFEQLAKITDVTEYVLYDIKTVDEDMHIACTGNGNRRILSNLRRLADRGQKLIIRLVIVPGYNDDLTDVKKRFQLIKSLGECVKRVDVLPYHTLGKGKYKRLGLQYPITGGETITDEYWKRFNAVADDCGVEFHLAEK